MPAATNAQVQQYVNDRVRPRAEQIRALYLACKDDRAAFDDIYTNLTNSPTWDDSNSSNPPHLLTPSDVLAWNTFLYGLVAFVEGTLTNDNKAEAAAQYPVILQACVRAPGA